MAPLRFHELRHTAAALMVNDGADPLQVKRRMGHEDIRTTFETYGRLSPTVKKILWLHWTAENAAPVLNMPTLCWLRLAVKSWTWMRKGGLTRRKTLWT